MMRRLPIYLFAVLTVVMASCAGRGSTVEFSVAGSDDPLTLFVQRPFGSVAPGYGLFTDTLELRPGVPVTLDVPVEEVSSLALSPGGKITRMLLEPGKNYFVELDNSDPAALRITVDDPAVQQYIDLQNTRNERRFSSVRDYTAAPLDTVAVRMTENFEALAAADRELYAGLKMSRAMRDAVHAEIELYWALLQSQVFSDNFFRQERRGVPMYAGYDEAWDELYKKYPPSMRYAPHPWFTSYAREYTEYYLIYEDNVDMTSITSEAEFWKIKYDLIYKHVADGKTGEAVLAAMLIHDGINNKTREEELLAPIEKFVADYPASPMAAPVASFADDIRNYHRAIAENADSSGIRFVENYDTITTLDEALARFRGKPVFLDFWFATCGPCHEEFRQSGPLKAFLSENDIETLYISIDPPELEKEWRDAISAYGLTGWHIRTNTQLHGDLDNNYGVVLFPTFMLVDASGTIVVSKARRPSEGEALFTQIREALKL